MADHPERGHARFTPVEMRRLWTYSDGAATVKAYRWPSGTAGAGRWVLVDQKTGNVQGVVPPGEFSRRFRPVDRFADVPGLPTYLETVTASGGTALVDLALDRNPFMLANGPGRVPRPHVLIVPSSHSDGWSSATAGELAACQTAMTLVAAWYRSMDGGHAVFSANDSAPNLDYRRDVEAADESVADGDTDAARGARPPGCGCRKPHPTWRELSRLVAAGVAISRFQRRRAGSPWLLPVSDRDKDVEIVVLRHQIAIPQRQLGTTRPRFSPATGRSWPSRCTGSRAT